MAEHDPPGGTSTPGERTGEHAPRGSVAPHGRRSDDLTLKDIWRLVRRARWIGAFAIFLGSATGWISGQAFGPVTKQVSLNGGRITLIDSLHKMEMNTIRNDAVRLSDRVDELADATKLGNYLTCTLVRRTDPAAVPPECSRVILDWRRAR